jgi:hypothetical protein
MKKIFLLFLILASLTSCENEKNNTVKKDVNIIQEL